MWGSAFEDSPYTLALFLPWNPCWLLPGARAGLEGAFVRPRVVVVILRSDFLVDTGHPGLEVPLKLCDEKE